MLRLRATLVLAVLLAPVIASGQASGQANPALRRFVYPNAKELISIDWAQIRQSPAGAMLREKLLTAGDMPAIPGIELLDDIDRVLISSPARNSQDDSAESPILIAIHGHFDPARVRHLFARSGAKQQAYNSFQVYRPQGKVAKDTAWVLFDSETILYGDAPSIFAALDRNEFAQTSAVPNPILARAGEMDANYEMWMIMDATEVMASDQIAALFQGGEWVSEAQGFEAGVNFRAGLAADITVRFSSDATAKRMTIELMRVTTLAAKDNSADQQLRDIAKKLKFNSDASATKISLRLTQQELEKCAEAFAAGYRASAQLAGNSGAASDSTPLPGPTPASAKPAMSKPMIRIEGLDEGTREIPYPDPQN